MNKYLDAPPDEEEITLRMWENDESCLEDIVRLTAPIERAIAKRFPSLKNHVEDIVTEAICRLWSGRKNYDSSRKLRPYLYQIAANVACELLEGRLNWQKARNLEEAKVQDELQAIPNRTTNKDLLENLEANKPELFKELLAVVNQLSDIKKDVVVAYALSGDYQLDAATLGIELGKKYCDGVPIPAGTIRQHKKRGMEFVNREMRKCGKGEKTWTYWRVFNE